MPEEPPLDDVGSAGWLRPMESPSTVIDQAMLENRGAVDAVLGVGGQAQPRLRAEPDAENLEHAATAVGAERREEVRVDSTDGHEGAVHRGVRAGGWGVELGTSRAGR